MYLYDEDTGYAYYLNTPPIDIVEEVVTPTPAPPTPTPTPSPTPAVSGSEGKNVNLNGKTPFTVRSSSHSASYQLALGMSESDVNTVLGDLSTNTKRKGKSPQGFDVISFRSDGYATYILIYLDPSTHNVVGIFSISSSGVSYNGVDTSYSYASSLGWSPVSWYVGDTSGGGAYSKQDGNANVIAFADTLGDGYGKVYGIQIFSTDYSIDDMTSPRDTTFTLDYSSAVTEEMATEAREMINAYLAFCDKGTRYNNSYLATVAQAFSDSVKSKGGTDAVSEGRGVQGLEKALNDIGKKTESDRAELLLIGNMDTIGFVNGVIESSTGREYIRRDEVTEIGKPKEGFRYIGIGVSAYHDGSDYYPNMVIDLAYNLADYKK